MTDLPTEEGNGFGRDVLMGVDADVFRLDAWMSSEVPKWLEPPIQAFRYNFSTIEDLSKLPIAAAAQSLSVEIKLLAQFDALLTGGNWLHVGEGAGPKREKYESDLRQALQKHLSKYSLDEMSERIEIIHARLLQEPSFLRATQAIPSALVTSLWTSLECLSKDVWVSTVNEYPLRLALSALGSSQVSPNSFAKHKFDFSRVMGSVLSAKFDFTSLRGIRRAYRAAFGDRFGRKVYPDDKKLYHLQLVRNVIVHRAGIVDDEFLRGYEGGGVSGESFLITSEFLESTVVAVKQASSFLLESVIRWADEVAETNEPSDTAEAGGT